MTIAATRLIGIMPARHASGISQPRLPRIKTCSSKNIRPRTSITQNQIIKLVAEYYDIPDRSIFDRTRKTEIVLPRQVAMYLIREDLQGSFPTIGEKFGGRDHTTAMHAYEKIKNEVKKNSKLEEDVRIIRQRYQNK